MGQPADSQLDAGFPLKSGDVAKKIAVCFWIKPESYITGGYLVAKYDTNGRRILGDCAGLRLR